MLSHCSRAPARLMVLHHEPSAARLCQSPLWALDVSNRASWATVSAGRLCSYPDHGNLSEDNNCHSATEVLSSSTAGQARHAQAAVPACKDPNDDVHRMMPS